MKTLRRTIIKTSVVAGALASALVVAMPGGAVIGGTAVSPAPSWSAYISVKQNMFQFGCSGALVSPNWVLTAARCVAPQTNKPCTYRAKYRAKSFTVYLGRTGPGPATKGTVYKVSSVSLNSNLSMVVDGKCVTQNDVALLHLKTGTTNTPLWIAPSQAAVTHGADAMLYGYGRTIKNKASTAGRLYTTKDGEWTLDKQCSLAATIAATCVDPPIPAGSAPAPGDAGAPWTMLVDGQPIEALVFSAMDLLHGVAYGTGVAQAATSAWLHTQLGIPTVAPGDIVQDTVSGDSWLIDSQGYRRSIPDQPTFTCLTGKGASVTDSDAASIALMAARTTPAACSGDVNVLIAGTGDGGWTAPNDNLWTLLKSAGYQVVKSAGLPSDLSGYNQVWWVDTNAPTVAQQNQLVAYEQAGGGLFLTGDGACCEPLSTALTTMINSMVVGGGVTAGGQGNLCTCTTNMPVNATAVGNLSQQPFAVTDWTVSQPGGMTGVSGSSVFAYYQPGDISTRKTIAAGWGSSSLVGNGHLVVFMDINWTEQGYRAANWSSVAQNAALFLSGLSSPPGPVVP